MAAKRILLVDDDHDTLQLLGLILQRAGMQITVADRMRSGLAKIPECNPDLIITDGLMPDGEGCELASLVRLHSEWNHIPIVLHDSITMADHQIRAAQAGVDDFIFKPTHPVEIVIRIRRLLARPLTWRTTMRSQRIMALISESNDQKANHNHYQQIRNLSDEALKEYDYPFWLLAEQLHPLGFILASHIVTSLREFSISGPNSSGTRALETIQEKQEVSYQLDIPVQQFYPTCLVVTDMETLQLIYDENRLMDLPIIYISREPLSEKLSAEIYHMGVKSTAVLSANTLVSAIRTFGKS